MSKVFYYTFILISLLSGQETVSQDVKFFNYKGYNTGNGLSSSNIRKIVQDPYGFIWVATQDGLNRYDGKNFIQFNANNLNPKHRLIGNAFSDIILDSATSTLWAVTSNGGLNKIDLQTCSVTERIKNSDLFKTNEQWGKMVFVSNSFVFVLSNTDVVAKYNFSTHSVSGLLDLPTISGLSSGIDNIFLSADKSNILFLRNGSIIFTDSTFKKTSEPIYPAGVNPSDTSEAYYLTLSLFTNHLLIASKNGLLALNIINKTFDLPETLSWLPKSILQIRTRTFHYSYPSIFIANDLGLIRADIDKKIYEFMTPSRNKEGRVWITNIFSIHSENSSCWIGSQSGFMIIPNIESPITGFSESLVGPEIKINHCYNLISENDSTLFSCASDGVYKINLNSGLIKQIDDTQPYYQTFYFKDQIYFSGTTNLKYLVNNRLVDVSSNSVIAKAIQNDFIIASAIYYDSLLFLGGFLRREIYEIDIKNNRVKTINAKSSPISTKNFAINNFFADKLGRLIIVCNEGISVYDVKKQKINHFSLLDPENNSLIELIMDGCEIGNKYYFAVYGKGIVETDKNFKITNIISEKEGLFNQGIYKLYNVGDSLLITGSNNGLFFYNIRTNKTSTFTKEQGTHSNSFDETSGTRYKDFIFLGGNEGFTKIEVPKIKINFLAPKLYFSAVEIKTSTKTIDTANLTLKSIKIPKDILQANIYFSTISFLNSEKVTIAYKIKERHSNWINIGTTNFLTLMGFNPGTYTLQVQAFNEDGVPSEIKELTLIFLPKWYQTLEFKVLIVIIILSIVYGLYRMRINHLKKEEKIRIQVASDLHDELGSTLNSVKIFTNLALMEKENKSHLEKIKESTQSAITGVKDIIWVLDDKRDTLDHLLARINQFARPICEANGISYNQQSGGNESHKLGKEEKRNLYMIIKESINNSIKYAECSIIELLIKNNGGKLSISISDDGKGFDKSETTSGYGLRNIKHRAGEIGYHAEINSSPGNGTLIYLEKK